jgi:hypothetical protein
MIELSTTVLRNPNNGSCAAYVNTTSCLRVSAIAEYQIQIKNDVLKLSEGTVIQVLLQRRTIPQ